MPCIAWPANGHRSQRPQTCKYLLNLSSVEAVHASPALDPPRDCNMGRLYRSIPTSGRPVQQASASRVEAQGNELLAFGIDEVHAAGFDEAAVGGAVAGLLGTTSHQGGSQEQPLQE